MIIEYRGRVPIINEDSYIAPTAIISGEVIIEEGVSILHGSVVTSEGSPILIKKNTVVMENSVLRATSNRNRNFSLTIGEGVLIGPNAFLAGCIIEDNVFLASGVKVYN